MVKKMPVTPRRSEDPQDDVVTRVPADDISHRAYRLFLARGSEHGHDVEDWLVAEAELLAVSDTEVASPTRRNSAAARAKSNPQRDAPLGPSQAPHDA
jgi:hypothetical protein